MPPTTPDPTVLRTVAPAKINWTLEVLGRRPDGYHEVRSVMQTISLEDRLTLRPAPALSLRIEGREAGVLTANDNLVTRAALSFPSLIKERPAAFTLSKEIPSAAGLGGGSSDAAAALRLLGAHWRLNERGRLAEAAAALGSDVPFFLRGGVQVAAGRGEQLTSLPTAQNTALIVATPPILLADKTARLYARLNPTSFTDGEATNRLAERLRIGADVRIEDCINVFDTVADVAFPHFAEYRRAFERATGERAVLAGSGPSLFSLRDDLDGEAGPELRRMLERRGFKAWIVHTTSSATATRRL